MTVKTLVPVTKKTSKSRDSCVSTLAIGLSHLLYYLALRFDTRFCPVFLTHPAVSFAFARYTYIFFPCFHNNNQRALSHMFFFLALILAHHCVILFSSTPFMSHLAKNRDQ